MHKLVHKWVHTGSHPPPKIRPCTVSRLRSHTLTPPYTGDQAETSPCPGAHLFWSWEATHLATGGGSRAVASILATKGKFGVVVSVSATGTLECRPCSYLAVVTMTCWPPA